MQLVVVVSCYAAILVNIVIAKDHDSGHKPGKDRGLPIKPHDQNQEVCTRKYPLTSTYAQEVPYAFGRYRIVPDLLRVAPTELVEVTYANISHCQPLLGNDVDICGLLHQPTLKWNYKSSKLYTVFLIDITPYGPLHPEAGAFGIMWFLVNIPGCDLDAGTPLSFYQTPTPVYGAGPMRYAILVYEQPAYKIDWSEEPIVKTT